jgi:hypothetical protein
MMPRNVNIIFKSSCLEKSNLSTGLFTGGRGLEGEGEENFSSAF